MRAEIHSRLMALAIAMSATWGCGSLEDPPEELPGLSCWDVNENGELDPSEDLDGDGEATVEDCRPEGGGGDSPWISDGAGAIVYNGNVGIGTMPRGNQLQVAGNVDAAGFSINGVPLSTSSDTYWSADAGSNIYYASGRVGIGTATPMADLDVAGTIRVSGGNPGEGKVLTSDAQGNANWRPIPSAFQPQVKWVKGTSDASISVSTWTDLPEMTVSMTTSGRPVVVQFHGNQSHGSNGDFRLLVDGQEVIQSNAITSSLNYAEVLAPGAHTFTVQWRRVGGSAELMQSASDATQSRTLLVMEI